MGDDEEQTITEETTVREETTEKTVAPADDADEEAEE